MDHTYNHNDIIDKQYNTCGCIILSKLDINENIIIDINIQYCKLHYYKRKLNNSLNYVYDYKIQKYLLISENVKKNNNLKSNDQNSMKYDKTDKTNNTNNKVILMDFGKYSNKTYDYVYNNDKMYCYKLAFWNNNIIKNKKITNFINFIKRQILIE